VCGMTPVERERGVWRLEGLPLAGGAWLLETDALADRDHPVLALFSPRLLREAESVSSELRGQGDEDLSSYVYQQISQFRNLGESFAMQHAKTREEMDQVWRDIFRSMSPELQREAVGLLSPEVIAQALTPEQREQLVRLLQAEPKKKPKRGKK